MPNFMQLLSYIEHWMHSQFSRRCTGSESSTGLCRIGPTKVKASKYVKFVRRVKTSQIGDRLSDNDKKLPYLH